MRPSVCGPAHGDKLATRCFSSGESLSRSEPVAIKLGPHERPTNDRTSLTGVLGGAFKGRRRLPEQRLLPVPREIRRIGFRAHPDLSFGLPRRGRMTYQATASGGHAGVALESHLGLELGAPELNGDHGHLGGHITSSVKVSFIHGPTVSALPDSIRLQMPLASSSIFALSSSPACFCNCVARGFRAHAFTQGLRGVGRRGGRRGAGARGSGRRLAGHRPQRRGPITITAATFGRSPCLRTSCRTSQHRRSWSRARSAASRPQGVGRPAYRKR